MLHCLFTESSIKKKSSVCFGTETAKRGVHAVGSVCGRHYDNMCTLLQAIHQGEQLRDDPSLNLPVSLRA